MKYPVTTQFSEPDLVHLFETGYLKQDKGKKLGYATEKDGNFILSPEALKEPTTFIRALNDYTRIRIARCDSDQKFLANAISEDEWNLYLAKCARKIFRATTIHKEKPTVQNLNRCVRGEAGEMVVVKCIQEMLHAFKNIEEENITIPIWSGDEDVEDLGNGYQLETLLGANFIVRGNHEKYSTPGEQDMMVRFSDSTTFFIDACTSEQRVNQKLSREKMPEKLFINFRNSMKKLFEETEGEKGCKHIAKLHIACSERKPKRPFTVVSRVDKKNTVVKALLPVDKMVTQMRKKIIGELKKIGILKIQSNGIYRLKEII